MVPTDWDVFLKALGRNADTFSQICSFLFYKMLINSMFLSASEDVLKVSDHCLGHVAMAVTDTFMSGL